MAIYHFNLRSIGRSTHAAGTAGAHIGYITRSGACRMVLGEHMPIPTAGSKGGKAREWLDEQEASDRKNARVIDKINIALPVELDETERVELIRTFMAKVTDGKVPWVAAIHDKGKDAKQPHGHVALRDRHIESGKRHVGMSERGAAERLRVLWEQVCNEALAKKGCEDQIDRRGLRVQRLEKLELAKEWETKDPAIAAAYTAEARALDRKPQISAGPVVRAIEQRGKRSTVISRATKARESLMQRFWKAVRGPDKAQTPDGSRNAARATREALRAYFATPAGVLEAARKAREDERRAVILKEIAGFDAEIAAEQAGANNEASLYFLQSERDSLVKDLARVPELVAMSDEAHKNYTIAEEARKAREAAQAKWIASGGPERERKAEEEKSRQRAQQEMVSQYNQRKRDAERAQQEAARKPSPAPAQPKPQAQPRKNDPPDTFNP